MVNTAGKWTLAKVLVFWLALQSYILVLSFSILLCNASYVTDTEEPVSEESLLTLK